MSRKKQFTELVGVMFTPETLNQLKKITDEKEVSKSEFVREIVQEKLNQKNLNLKKRNKKNEKCK